MPSRNRNTLLAGMRGVVGLPSTPADYAAKAEDHSDRPFRLDIDSRGLGE